MKIRLKCRDDIREDKIKELASHGIEVCEDAQFTLVETAVLTQYLIGYRENKMEIIKDRDIIYFEALSDLVYCHTARGVYEIKDKLYQLEQKYAGKPFVRVSKSHIVNVQQIVEILPWIGMKYVLKMKNNEEVDVNRTYYSHFKKYLGL